METITILGTVQGVIMARVDRLAEAYLMAAEQGDKTERADWLKKARRACWAP
jgi:hypothetical protein